MPVSKDLKESKIDPVEAIKFVNAPSLPDPQWYSHGVSINPTGRLILTSGQIGQRKDGSFPSSFGEQVQQAVSNLASVLRAAGSSPRDIVQLRFYCVDWSGDKGLDLVQPVLQLLTESYGVKYRPLTTLVAVPKLAFPEIKFEIEAIASVGGLSRPWVPSDGHLPVTNQTEIANTFPVPAAELDVIVVGGGLSGLMAGYEATQAGLKAVVLEARHRIGGRSYSMARKSGDGVIELGGTWINRNTQPVIYSLTQKFGLETEEQYTAGVEVFQNVDGKITRVGDTLERRTTDENLETTERLQTLFALVSEACDQLDIRKWHDYPESEDVSVAEWVRRKGIYDDPVVQGQLKHMTSAIVGREPEEMGVHYFFDYIKSGCGFTSIISEGEFGAQSLKVKKGTSAIAMALASAIGADNVLIHTPVASITQYSKDVTVTCTGGQVFKARKVILANPTHTYSNIRFSPPLPSTKRAVFSRTEPGIYAKMVASYSTPWWREAGLVGKFTSLLGPICFSWDTSDLAAEQYSLAFFMAGERAAKWHALNQLAREDAIIEHLVTLVGPELEDKARDVLEVNYVEWTKEEYIGGAPTSAMGPGLLRKYGAELRKPFRNLHFAGGELAYEWKGYLEGAVTSGQRAAVEAVQALKQDSSKL